MIIIPSENAQNTSQYLVMAARRKIRYTEFSFSSVEKKIQMFLNGTPVFLKTVLGKTSFLPHFLNKTTSVAIQYHPLS
jgi:hypothetical protein